MELRWALPGWVDIDSPDDPYDEPCTECDASGGLPQNQRFGG